MTVGDLLTSHGLHSDRPVIWPIDDLLAANAADLCVKVNQLFTWWKSTRPQFEPERACVSGYRPPEVNTGVPGAVPGDAHETCEASDFSDGDGELAAWCVANTALLRQVGLYMEDPSYTKTLPKKGRRGWVHLQSRPVPSGHIVFIPYNSPPEEDA